MRRTYSTTEFILLCAFMLLIAARYARWLTEVLQ